MVIGLFGGLLNLPDSVRDISPFTHIPAFPISDWTPLTTLLIIAAALAAVAIFAFGRRDLNL
ncbi:MAG: hypothetical protein H0T91_08075 [Propionibacteriaceae bacterium]|nr:hypothetical protein [Propionibacteriaceae bacterium]